MMPSSVVLPDLDTLDSHALKSLILQNHALLLDMQSWNPNKVSWNPIRTKSSD
jgi:hypothetical protein